MLKKVGVERVKCVLKIGCVYVCVYIYACVCVFVAALSSTDLAFSLFQFASSLSSRPQQGGMLVMLD